MRCVIIFFYLILFLALHNLAYAQDKKVLEDKRSLTEKQLKTNLEYYIDKKSKVEAKIIDNYLYKPLSPQPLQEAAALILQENAQKEQLAAEAKALGVGISETESKKNRLYGPSPFDSRIELRQLNPLIPQQNNILTNSASVGLLVRKEALQSISDSIFEISTITLKKKYNLCSSEPFGDQPVAGEATVFILNDSTVMTAAHVLTEAIDKYAIIFGFEIKNKQGVFSSFINASNVYFPGERQTIDRELDVTLLSLQRKTDRKPLVLATSEKYNNAAEVYMIGYPSGLPAKVALNAEIQKDSGIYFYTSLDAFQGNSGAPVFSQQTNEVIGILVSGNIDFRAKGNCYISTLCKYPYCLGEKVLKSNVIYQNFKDKIQR
ncbi:serine protease [Pedobacter miscanthi]|uniref:trypsin-like serine peptidase n=1 Tax=Pedobacter miscanthi TaxID=2259170 RepID=UPI002931D711|nr:serine protease [Pedobacter miscanthi]